MTFFCGVYGCRGFRHQIEGDEQVLSVPIIAHELRHVCIPIGRSVYVTFIAEFHFTFTVFGLGCALTEMGPFYQVKLLF
jgi:hypothetical protein